MPPTPSPLQYASPTLTPRTAWAYAALLTISLIFSIASIYVLFVCLAWGRTIALFIGLPAAAIQMLVTTGILLFLRGHGATLPRRMRHTLLLPAILGATVSVAAVILGLSFEDGCC